MHSRRLLTILLVGTLASACTQVGPYRTELPEVSAPGAPATYPEIAVDSNALGPDEKRMLSTHPDAAGDAIQHRFYSASFTGEGAQDDLDQGDYYLSFVEFDDQGWFAEREQMVALLALLEELKEQRRETLIYVYAHGWKHNASVDDDNVVYFSRLLERLNLLERKVLEESDEENPGRAVVGVYLGWRGLPYNASVLTNLSFWNRKKTAARVGRGGVFELLTRLNDYRNARRSAELEYTETLPTQLIITGHSFGGLVIYSALSHALMEGAARVERGSKQDWRAGAVRYEAAQGFGDFVLLVNPAFEGSLYEPLYQIATNRSYGKQQRPVMMIVTSKADSATRVAFPAGRTLSTLFENKKFPDQATSLVKTVGHDPRYLTHELEYEPVKNKAARPAAASKGAGDPEYPLLAPTAEWSQESLLDLFGSMVETALGSKSYGEGIRLTPSWNPPNPERTPFLVVSCDEDLIADHNAIYSERFINFVQLFLFRHILMPEVLAPRG